MVIQTLTSWGALERVEKAKRIVRLAPTVVEDDALTTWLIEAAVRNAGKALAIASLPALPVLFPFKLTRPLAWLLSNCEHLVVRAEGPGNQLVALREEF